MMTDRELLIVRDRPELLVTPNRAYARANHHRCRLRTDAPSLLWRELGPGVRLSMYSRLRLLGDRVR
jgi:hypothetical protein